MYALNSLNRSLCLADAYPFTLSPKVVAKLRFVHNVIASASASAPKQADGGIQQHEGDPQAPQAAAAG